MKLAIKFIIIIFPIFVCTSCSVYYANIESLKDQYREIDSSQFKQVNLKGIYGDYYSYEASPVNYIDGFDKNKEAISFDAGPSVILKITKVDKSSTNFYFDRFYMNDSIVYGVESRAKPVIKSIFLKNIKSIQILGRNMGFEYVD